LNSQSAAVDKQKKNQRTLCVVKMRSFDSNSHLFIGPESGPTANRRQQHCFAIRM